MKSSSLRVRGFTILELLIVIAIIGILSAVILAAVNIARAKAVDAATKSNLNTSRAQGTIYYDDNGTSYTGICGADPDANGVPSLNTALLGAQKSSNTLTQPLNIDLTVDGSFNTVTCHENGMAWADEAPLTSSVSGSPVMWCDDSTGNSKQETTNLLANSVACL